MIFRVKQKGNYRCLVRKSSYCTGNLIRSRRTYRSIPCWGVFVLESFERETNILGKCWLVPQAPKMWRFKECSRPISTQTSRCLCLLARSRHVRCLSSPPGFGLWKRDWPLTPSDHPPPGRSPQQQSSSWCCRSRSSSSSGRRALSNHLCRRWRTDLQCSLILKGKGICIQIVDIYTCCRFT